MAKRTPVRNGNPTRTARPTATLRRRRAWPVFKWLMVGAVWASIAVSALVVWYAADLPDVDTALAVTRTPAVTILAADGSELATAGELHGVPVQVADLPPALPRAVLATEDRRFYEHSGLDVFAVVRAAVANVRAGHLVQGGSTITQQAAKNLFLSPEKTYKRKIQELLLAFWLEHKFSKDQILAIYLNRAYFGAGVYGVDAAARKYFGKPASEVSTYQAAMLAGLLKAPSRYNPLSSPVRAENRTAQVLAGMVDAGYLSQAEADAAERYRSEIVDSLGHRYGGRYFVDWVMTQIGDFVSARDQDIIVTTTLDPRLQGSAEQLVADALAKAGAKADVSQAAVVTLAPDGAVRAMVGGRNYAESQFNRAVQALRQPGSAFKPVAYLAGMEAGLRPDTRMVDAPVTVDGWSPRNFSEKYQGTVNLKQAMAKSINTVAVQVSEQAGRKNVIGAARRLGITTDLKATPSLALGAWDVTLLELTAAYAAFANGGIGVWPYGIESIHDAEGHLLYARSGTGPGRVIDPEYAAAITDMLIEVVRTGTGRGAQIPRPVAGKTGTSQNHRDAWFIGYSADLVTGVWMGNDDGRPMKGVTGGGAPARLWQAVMAEAHRDLPVQALIEVDYASIEPAVQTPAVSVTPQGTADAGGGSPDFWDRLMNVFGRAEPAVIRRHDP